MGDNFEVDGTTYQLFRMYETVGEDGKSNVACAYFEKELALSMGLENDYFCNLDPEHER